MDDWSKARCVNSRHVYLRPPDVMQHFFITSIQHGLSQREIHDYAEKFPEALLHEGNN